VIAGEGRNEIAVLVFPSVSFSKEKFQAESEHFNLPSAGSSSRVERFAVLEEPPSLDAGEITDKGTINQKAVLSRRKKLVDRLYSLPSSTKVIHYR
jgi:hypothetical protein